MNSGPDFLERFAAHGKVVRVTEAEVVYVAVNQDREKVRIGEQRKTENG